MAGAVPKLTVVLGILVLSGCFSAVRAYRQELVCTADAARRAGDLAARSGKEPEESYGRICEAGESGLNRIYQEAYDSVPADERDSLTWLDRLLRRSPSQPDAEASAN